MYLDLIYSKINVKISKVQGIKFDEQTLCFISIDESNVLHFIILLNEMLYWIEIDSKGGKVE